MKVQAVGLCELEVSPELGRAGRTRASKPRSRSMLTVMYVSSTTRNRSPFFPHEVKLAGQRPIIFHAMISGQMDRFTRAPS
mmetsp:Transcript_73615/g.204633  ORF Transcript_73615/g.204633 Transcript_73615/m.204633 type:complete len:81 (-) Transcript_73615:672-914(-)